MKLSPRAVPAFLKGEPPPLSRTCSPAAQPFADLQPATTLPRCHLQFSHDLPPSRMPHCDHWYPAHISFIASNRNLSETILRSLASCLTCSSVHRLHEEHLRGQWVFTTSRSAGCCPELFMWLRSSHHTLSAGHCYCLPLGTER